MTAVAHAALAIVRRDARIFRSYRFRLLREVVGAAFTVALFYELSQLVSSQRFPTAAAYFEYAVVGLAFTPLLRSALMDPPALLRDELLTGSFERLAFSPLGVAGALLASLIFPLCLALVTGGLILALATVGFGLRPDVATVALALPVGALAALAIAPLGGAILAAGVLFKQAGAGSGWILAGLSLIGGVYFPAALLPDWIGWSADAQPVTPALHALRDVVLDGPADGTLGVDMLKLAGFAAVGLPLAALALRAACAHARRRGTLLES